MSEPRYCEFMVYRATLETPAEYCPNEAEPGEEYCLDHMPYEWDDVDLPYSFDWEYEGDIE